MNCFAGEGHVVDEDSFPQYLDVIRLVIKKDLTLSRSSLKLRNFMARLSLSRNLLTNFA